MKKMKPLKSKRYHNLNMFSCAGGNCYVIRCHDGDILIDTGPENCRDEIEVWLMNYNIKLIVLTHGHNDHIGNAAYFSELYDVPIAMNSCDIPLIGDNLRRKSYIMNGAGFALTPARQSCLKKSCETFTPDYDLYRCDKLTDTGINGTFLSPKIMSLDRHGDPVRFDEKAWYFPDNDMYDDKQLADLGFRRVLITPLVIPLDGHTRGSIGILDGRDLYCGDALMNSVLSLEPPSAESPKAALKTLNRIAVLSPLRIFPGHGEPIIRGDKLYKKLLEENL